MKGNRGFTSFVKHNESNLAKIQQFSIKNLENKTKKFYESLETDYGKIKLNLPANLTFNKNGTLDYPLKELDMHESPEARR